jgi:type IV secretion system protein VirB1
MPISIAAALLLAEQCAPTVAPETILSIVQVESGFNALAIGVNGSPQVRTGANGRREAVAIASGLIAAGRNIDLGLAQINSKNLGWLHLSVEDAFDPCRNLAASARVLQDGYARARPQATDEQAALATAFSFYNTGKPDRGFANGYVAKVARAAERIVPAIRSAAVAPVVASAGEPNQAQEPPDWDVFAQTRGHSAFVVRVATQEEGE